MVRCFLEIKRILEKSDIYHHFVRLYIQDYIIWIQQCSPQKLKSVYKELKKVEISKEELGWPLHQLELEALEKAMQMEEDDIDNKSKPLPLDS